MTSSEREQPPSHRIYVASQSSKDRLDLERKILAACFKICFESADSQGAAVAHKGLCAIIQQQLFSGDGSSGSVIPKSVWQQASASQQADAEHEAEVAEATALATDVAKEAAAVSEALAQQAIAYAQQAEQDAIAAEAAHDAATAALRLEIPTLSEAELAEMTQADPTAPLNYLDFGAEDEAPADSMPEPVPAPVEAVVGAPPAAPLTPSQLIRTQSFYQILGVSQVASFQEIHTRYLRLMGRLLRSRYSMQTSITDMREFREVLRAVCVAHDVLKDPITRADYDLRQIGMRHEGAIETPVDAPPVTTRTRLMLGELLECAEILDATELQIALDMHKAEPGIQFGEFLVTSHFLSQEELDCALLAQGLISKGKITVNQFRTGMYRMRDNGTAFFDTLMTEGWLSPADIFDPASDLWGADPNAPPPEAPPAAIPHTPLPKVPELMEHPELMESESEEDEEQEEQNNHHDGNGSHSTPAPAPAAVAAGKSDYNNDWSEKDALAETQSIDLSAFRAQLESVPDDSD